jgi:hypothetical protein
MLHTFVIHFVFYLTTVCKIAQSRPIHFHESLFSQSILTSSPVCCDELFFISLYY